MRRIVWMLVVWMWLSGCAGSNSGWVAEKTLPPPPGSPAAVVSKMQEGDRLYAAKDWAGAKSAYWAVIQTDQSLAEAHYDYALVLDQLGEKAESKKHYLQAANLAPGNKVIWDAPPFRTKGFDYNINKPSFQDTKPR